MKAWCIGAADRDFTEGLKKLKELKETKFPQGTSFKSRLGVVADITNAILSDARVFRIEDGDLLIKMGTQIHCEINHWKGWQPEIGPEALQEQAMERLQKQGWDKTRPVLALIVRTWIFTGFTAQRVTSNFPFAFECHKTHSTSLIGGAKHGKMSVFTAPKKNTDMLEGILEEAEAILKDLEDHPYDPKSFAEMPDFGFYLAYFANIKASALAIKGLYYRLMAEANVEKNPGDVETHYAYAIQSYMEAASYRKTIKTILLFLFLLSGYLFCAYQIKSPDGHSCTNSTISAQDAEDLAPEPNDG
ncbi:hypothetical protein D9757_002472 [Collybiopsis confluens]|uniref:Uncharacterized protein n=1 Tax=Collybiopsis confluens TaxID=2823264 RepID=A0A8H5HXY4_9AGAR|nr:hypothetical protein D9757_002472 [Collybiopsis confluens]